MAACWLATALLFATQTAPEWKPDAQPDWFLLMQGGRQLGAYRVSTRQYWPRLASGQFGDPTPPPIAPPASVPRADGVSYNGGIDLSQLSHGEIKCSLTGRPVDAKTLFHAIGDATLPDDAAYRRLTLFADSPTDHTRFQALAEQAMRLAQVKNVIVSAYPRDSWVARDNGFQVTAPVTVYYQEPGGQVIWREERWLTETELARGLNPKASAPGSSRPWDALTEALRRIRPDYDPGRDRRIPGGAETSEPVLLWLCAGLILVALLSRK